MHPQQQSKPRLQYAVDPQPPQTSSPRSEPSCFELLNRLRRRMIIARRHILAHIALALKDEAGNFSWVELDPKFRSHLFKLAFSLLGELITPAAQKMYKKAIFVYILEILNQEGEEPLSSPKRNREKTARTKWEKLPPTNPAPPTITEDHQHKEDMGNEIGQQTEAPAPIENTPANTHAATPPPDEPVIANEQTNDTPVDPWEKEVEEFLHWWSKTNPGITLTCDGAWTDDCGRPATHVRIIEGSMERSYGKCEDHSRDCDPIPDRLL